MSKYDDLIPEGAARVRVKDENGDILYRDPDDILDTDTLEINPKTGKAFVMMSHPGRPPMKGKPALPSSTTASSGSSPLADIVQEKRDAIATDELLKKLRESGESFDVVKFLMEELAAEAIALRVEREHADSQGKDTSHISLRRAQIIKHIADTFFKRRRAQGDNEIDMEGRMFQIVFKHLCETFMNSLQRSKVSDPMIDLVMNDFARTVDSDTWKDECKRRMKS